MYPMGIENREYMWDESSPLRRGRSDHPWLENVVKTLIIVNVIVFVAQILTMRPMSFSEFAYYYAPVVEDVEQLRQEYDFALQSRQLPRTSLITELLSLKVDAVYTGQIWRLTTYDFLHSTDGMWHIFFNMFVLYLAGGRVADRYGHFEFLWFYLVSGVFAGIFYLVWGLLSREHSVVLGASGAVSAVLVLYAMNWPRQQWYLYGILPVPVYLLVLISAAMDLLPMLSQLQGGEGDRIAHSAHIGGMLFGFLYYKQGWVISSLLPGTVSMPRWSGRRKSKLRVHQPVEDRPTTPERPPIPTHVERRVDDLLAKISEQGEASLTAEEREFLNESSRKYRS